MKIFRLAKECLHRVDAYGSHGFAHTLVVAGQDVQVGWIRLEERGRIGRHAASGNQLLWVMVGTGWASGNDARQMPIGPEMAVWWADGEPHETTSEGGLVAVVIEGTIAEPSGPAWVPQWPEKGTGD